MTTPKTPHSSDSWADWLVYADWLTERDDARGQIVVLDHRLSITPDREFLLLEVMVLVDAWREEFDAQLSMDDACWLDEYLNWAVALQSFGNNVPKSFLDLFRFPMSRLIATMCTDQEEPKSCQILEEHFKAVRDGLVLWIESVFDGVPVPQVTLHQAHAQTAHMNYSRDDRTRDHRGRWQDIPEEHFRECGEAFFALEPGGIAYYLPAAMCLILQIDDFYPESFSLMPYRWDRWDEESLTAWLRVVKEERDGPRQGGGDARMTMCCTGSDKARS